MRIDKNTTIKLGDRNIIKIKIGDNVIWEKSTVNYFYIQNTSEGDNTVTFKTTASNTLPSSDLYSNQVEYSTDKRNWNTLTFNKTTPQTVTISGGEKLYLRNNSRAFNYFASYTSRYITTINTSQSCILGGNINTLLNYNDADVNLKDGCFYELFKGCTSLTDVSNLELPSTTLSSYCYQKMFYGCTSLINTPSLPATELASRCYFEMFSDCTSLTSAPELPATTLVDNCYHDMFYRCTSLVNAPSLPATTLANGCYYDMFGGCTSLVNAPELLATTLASECYQSMFSGCTSLVNAPELPATTLADNCYYDMFKGCTSLTSTPTLPATTLTKYCYNGMFNGCTGLTSAPELPATTLANYCYYGMFNGCTGLTSAPELPATTLANSCYNGMFNGCTGLTSAPTLPATELANSCYNGMFKGCTGLTSAPELPATTLKPQCYYGMFKDCTGLISTPELPATELANSCYNGMFNGCTSLTSTPTLPATTLAGGCYNSMFSGCSSLVNAPELPATELVNSCYYRMFYNCSLINEVTVYADDINATDCTKNWLAGVSSPGTFYNYGAAEYNIGSPSGVPSGWTEVRPDYFYVANNYEGTNTISIKQTITGEPDSSLYAKTLQYSKDKTNWSTIILSDAEYNISLNSGEILYMRGNEGVLNYYANDGAIQAITNILGTQSHTIGGNINTLVNYITPNELTLTQGVFAELFQNNTTITSAENLTLPPSMDGSLSNYAYYLMFSGCSALITPPSEIPATKQGHASCGKMFLDCTQLKTPPALKSTILGNYCFTSIFKNCTSLISAPELPALTLTSNCYHSAFEGCSSLNEVTVYANDISATNCTTNWLSGVASTGTFNNMGSATYEINSASGIPTGWTEVKPIDETNYLYIENVDESDCELSFTTYSSTTLPPSDKYTNRVEFSTDKETWTTWNFDTANTLTIPIGGKVYLRNDSGAFSYYGTDGYYYLTSIKTTMKCNVGGNLNTLLNYNEEILDISDKRSCFRRLFVGAKIVDASKLVMPATTLSQYCYADFFSGNSSLIAPPELPAVNLADYCYYNFFRNCTSLVNSPELPTTTLADSCYRELFYGCTSLVNPPELPATTLASNCYWGLFDGCTKLNNITVYANDISATNCTNNWLSGVASSGTFNNYGSAIYTANSPSGIPSGWTQNRDNTNYFYIQNKTSNSTNFEIETSSYNTTSDNYAKSLQYSKDKKTWTTINLDSNNSNSIVLYPGEKVYFRNDSGYFNWCDYEELGYIYSRFNCYENYAVGGNVMSLIDYNNMDTAQLSDGCFSNLFYESYYLTDASKLILPNKTSPNCFKQMFYNCPELTKAPKLPATELSDGCYKEMFYLCSKLNSLTVYANNVNVPDCTINWLVSVASTGTFRNLGSATYDRGPSGIPVGWTEVKS